MFPELTRDDVFRLETRRLWLRWPRLADGPAILRQAGAKPVAEMTAAIPHPYPPEAVEPFVFATRKGNALLADFGIAKLSGLEFFTDPRMGIRGKLPFMSPERVMGQAIDGRSDEFSAALLFLELSSGIRPYAVKPGETFAVLRERVARRDLPKPRALVPGMSRRVEGVVLRALEARINKRFPTCGEFAVALEEALRKEQQLGGAPALAELIALVAPPRGPA